MQLKFPLAIVLLLILGYGKLFSQVVYKEYHFENNKTTVPDSIKNLLTERSVLFFIPSYELSQEDSIAYTNKTLDLYKRLRTLELSNLYVRCFYFHQDLKSKSNGLQISGRNNTKTILVDQLECFLVNFDTTLLYRALKLFKSSFKNSDSIKEENLYKISIVEGNKCFAKIQDRIPSYFDFIKESVQPNYSMEERIDRVFESVAITKKELTESQQSYNCRIESKLDSILDILGNRSSQKAAKK